MSPRSRLDGHWAIVLCAGFFLLLGTAILWSTLTGQTSVQWTGSSVAGKNVGGIVYYTIGGTTYSLDHSSRFASNTVYYDPHDPIGTATLGYPIEHALELGTIIAAYGVGLVIIGVDLLRRRAYRRAAEIRSPDAFGHGLDPEVVRRLIDRRNERP